MKFIKTGLLAFAIALILSITAVQSSQAEIQRIRFYLFGPISNDVQRQIQRVLQPWVDTKEVEVSQIGDEGKFLTAVEITPKKKGTMRLYQMVKQIRDMRIHSGAKLWKTELVATGRVFDYIHWRRANRDVYPRKHYALQTSKTHQVILLRPDAQLDDLKKLVATEDKEVTIVGEIPTFERSYPLIILKQFGLSNTDVAKQILQKTKAES